MHRKNDPPVTAPPTVEVTFHMEDPEPLTGKHDKLVKVMAAKGENLLDVALDHGINVEHACGGVCACSTCHVYIRSGEESLREADDDELDRVEEAPALQVNSRLSCQSVITGDGPVEVEVPAWNRNAVKEVPH
ncbi:MAG: 2Fe-2S iron-sulfur cluster binding domain-containing protein [Phycisphaera sp.]|nr:2Fe-2S iron-sulfur cluster binding domain-containing protein [Phycisphaera sp.]